MRFIDLVLDQLSNNSNDPEKEKLLLLLLLLLRSLNWTHSTFYLFSVFSGLLSLFYYKYRVKQSTQLSTTKHIFSPSKSLSLSLDSRCNRRNGRLISFRTDFRVRVTPATPQSPLLRRPSEEERQRTFQRLEIQPHRRSWGESRMCN